MSTEFSGCGDARRVPSIFCRSNKCQHRVANDERATAASLDGWGLLGRLANLWLASRRFWGASLTRIACAKDLVGGAEDALGGTLGECLALAP